MIVFPNAKINLGLNIVERRSDGYHNLETLFYPIPLEDVLEVMTFDEAIDTPHPTDVDYTFQLHGIQVAGIPEDNLVVRAYRLMKEEFDIPPVHIYMYKHIPSGAGLGGGSADATFMLRLLRDKFDLPLTDDDLERRSVRLGADCPFFVRNTPSFATGIGDVFTPMPQVSLGGYTLILVKPDIFVSTRDAFSLVRPHRPHVAISDLVTLPISQWREAGLSNDFEESVFAIHPTLFDVKQRLYDLGALYASMSGSGSSLFGIFYKSPFENEQKLREAFPDSFCWSVDL